MSQSLNIEKDSSRKNSLCLAMETRKCQETEENNDKETNGLCFVTQLKKTDPNKKVLTKEKSDLADTAVIVDFKSRLRKVDAKKDG